MTKPQNNLIIYIYNKTSEKENRKLEKTHVTLIIKITQNWLPNLWNIRLNANNNFKSKKIGINSVFDILKHDQHETVNIRRGLFFHFVHRLLILVYRHL